MLILWALLTTTHSYSATSTCDEWKAPGKEKEYKICVTAEDKESKSPRDCNHLTQKGFEHEYRLCIKGAKKYDYEHARPSTKEVSK